MLATLLDAGASPTTAGRARRRRWPRRSGRTAWASVDGRTRAPLGRGAVVDAVAAAVARVEALGLPESVVHGDFHSGNAAFVDGRIVIIDWSDAAIGNPAIDLVTWLVVERRRAGRGRRGDRRLDRRLVGGRRPDALRARLSTTS